MNRVTMQKWLEIVRFELVYQFRRKSTWIFFAVFLLPLFGETNGQVLEALETEVLFFAPLFLAESSIGMALIALLVMAPVTGNAATRDVETRIEPLMHAAPIRRAAYLGGRFFGAFTWCALLLLMVPLALILARFLHPDLTPALAGPFRPAAFLQTYFLLLLPNAFVAVAVMFTLAVLMRHTLGSYLGGAAVLMGTILSTQLVGQAHGRWELAKLINPSGHTSIALMTKTWSPIDLNTRLVGLGEGLLWNRLLWLGLACALLALTYSRFRYGANVTARWWQRGRALRARMESLDASLIAGSAPLTVPHVPKAFGAAGRAMQLAAVTRDSIREMVTRWSWLVLTYFAFHVIVATREVAVRGTPLVGTTGRVLAAFFELPPPMILGIFLFAILAAGELVWRERDANMSALSDAAPAPNWVRFTGKLLGLWLVIVALHALLLLADMVIQMRLGSYDFDFALYFQVLFGLQLAGPLLFALAALSVHVLVNQKHIGHVAVFASFAVASAVAQTFGIEHPLLFPFAAPGFRHSAISGFAPYLGPFLWFKLYWAAWALLLAIVAGLFWVRGVNPRLRERVSFARRRFRGMTAIGAAAVAGLVLVVGGFLFYNTNILNEYVGSAEGAGRLAEYERRYGRYEGAPQPQLAGAKLSVELDPERRQADIRGVYTLVNRTARPIDTIHVAVSFDVETSAIELDRPARATRVDDELGHRIYTLATPLAPGQPLRMTWQVRHHARGIPARVPREVHTAVLGNGTFIQMAQWMPLLGYQTGRELAGTADRKAHGLPPRPDDARSLDNLAARRDPTGQDRFALDVTVGTAANQTAVAPGRLQKTWTRNGRRYFHYVTDAPIGLGFALFSAEYAVTRARWRDVELEVFHHPPHTRNLQRMLRGMELSLEQYTRRFGPYPYKVLRMIEYTRKDGGAHAAAGNIWFSEVFPLLDPSRDERRFDLPFAVVAHEMGHQFQVSPARVEGRGLLSESFAWYAAMGVIEAEYGPDHLARFLGFMRRDYLNPRARADVPLLRASDWFLSYRKGPFAMYALREYVGQEKVDLAWRRLIAKHASHQPPFATSLDLYRELQAVTPDALRTLLGDLLERNTFWELKTYRATARQTTNGQWQVSLDVAARKVVVDTEGVETTVPMNDPIEIGVFAGDKPLSLAMHRIRPGSQTITITVPQRPTRAGIDPRNLLIDVEPWDNVWNLE